MQSERHVSRYPAPESMARLTALLPWPGASPPAPALRAHADGTAGGEAGSRGQVMADALVERVTGQARRMVADPSGGAAMLLRRLCTRPRTGQLAALDTAARLFTANQRRFLLLRDRACRTPWCEAPIRHADHIRAAADRGPTAATPALRATAMTSSRSAVSTGHAAPSEPMSSRRHCASAGLSTSPSSGRSRTRRMRRAGSTSLIVALSASAFGRPGAAGSGAVEVRRTQPESAAGAAGIAGQARS